jgi:hypothetical protein
MSSFRHCADGRACVEAFRQPITGCRCRLRRAMWQGVHLILTTLPRENLWARTAPISCGVSNVISYLAIPRFESCRPGVTGACQPAKGGRCSHAFGGVRTEAARADGRALSMRLVGDLCAYIRAVGALSAPFSSAQVCACGGQAEQPAKLRRHSIRKRSGCSSVLPAIQGFPWVTVRLRATVSSWLTTGRRICSLTQTLSGLPLSTSATAPSTERMIVGGVDHGGAGRHVAEEAGEIGMLPERDRKNDPSTPCTASSLETAIAPISRQDRGGCPAPSNWRA